MRKAFWRTSLMLFVTLALGEVISPLAFGAPNRRGSLGTVTGSVRDSKGRPLAGAIVMLLRDGAEVIIKRTKSAADGSFTARVAPGRYLLRAVADGFSVASFSAVQITPSAELVYRFNLEPIGEGRTVPERRRDRDDRKWDIRAAQHNRSIFQMNEDAEEVALAGNTGNIKASMDEASDEIYDEEAAATSHHIRPHGVIETFYAASSDSFRPNRAGINFAVASPVNDRLDLIFAGQLGAFERFDATARMRLNDRHRLSATIGGLRAPVLTESPRTGINGTTDNNIGQVSMRAVDEWVVRDGVVVVLGFDYSRFVGDSSADSWSPRIGFQFDANARTRLKAAYAPGGDSTRAASVAVFEDSQVIFREPAAQPVAFVDGRAVMEQSRRLEFGVERVLDNRSSIEASAFFDTTDGRGVGLLSTPLNAFSNENGAELLNGANQQGAARGVRVVYVRRISRFLKASAGYSFGRGQQLSLSETQASPESMFQSGLFQTAAAQVDADVSDRLTVRTVLRFSPRAAVFAIDPFAGQLAVYDPSLSILVTRELPTFGLPVRAEAVLDARNLLDVLTSVEDGEKLTSVSATRRSVRGGISVRF
ncbi:MAG: carboxypeptidase-like regulatory domain-containing protein [Acidobacteriota bacterium]|nr:carboxypeptidase-like regulatory domain-containing protein [Acidobacteriota bacterium]